MTARKLSDAAKAHKTAYDNQYNRDNYDRLAVFVRAGDREKIKAHAAARGESVNAFINRAIAGQLQRDGGDPEAGDDASE